MDNIEAILWDNDGVLVDSEAVFFDVTRRVLKNSGLKLSGDLWRSQYLGKGKGTADIAKSLGANPAKISSIIDERNRQYKIALGNPPLIRPHVRETLVALFSTVQMGIVTGCKREQLQLMHRKSGILGFFDFAITSDDYCKPKPNPEPYLTAVKHLGINPIHCIAIEDSQRGVRSALAANINCIAIPTELTAHQDFSGAISVEDNVSAILKYVGLPLNNERDNSTLVVKGS